MWMAQSTSATSRDQRQQVVEDDLAVEAGHEVVDRGRGGQVRTGADSGGEISMVVDDPEQARCLTAQVGGHGCAAVRERPISWLEWTAATFLAR